MKRGRLKCYHELARGLGTHQVPVESLYLRMRVTNWLLSFFCLQIVLCNKCLILVIIKHNRLYLIERYKKVGEFNYGTKWE